MLTLEEIRAKYPQYANKSDQELLGALHKKFYSQMPIEEFMSNFQNSPENPQALARSKGIDWGQIGNDVLSGGVGAVTGIGDIISSIPQLPGQLSGIGNMSGKRGLENILFGLAQGGHGLLNTPSNIANYLAERNVISPESAAYIPRQSDEGFQDPSWFLGEEQEGDALLQGLSRLAPNLIAGGPVRAAALEATGRNENPLSAAGSLGLVKALGSTAKGVNNLRRNNVAKGVVAGEKAAKKTAGNSYKDIFKEAESRGLGKDLTVPKIDFEAIKSGTPGGKYTKYLKKIEADPTLENFQKARSDLKKFIRANENKAGDQALRDSLNAAINAEKKISNKIYKALGEGEGSLTEKLMKTDKSYKETVVPYAKNKALQEYKRGEIAGSDLVKSLAKSKNFNYQLGAEHPEVKLSHAAHGFGKLDPAFDTFSAMLSKISKNLKGKK